MSISVRGLLLPLDPVTVAPRAALPGSELSSPSSLVPLLMLTLVFLLVSFLLYRLSKKVSLSSRLSLSTSPRIRLPRWLRRKSRAGIELLPTSTKSLAAKDVPLLSRSSSLDTLPPFPSPPLSFPFAARFSPGPVTMSKPKPKHRRSKSLGVPNRHLSAPSPFLSKSTPPTPLLIDFSPSSSSSSTTDSDLGTHRFSPGAVGPLIPIPIPAQSPHKDRSIGRDGLPSPLPFSLDDDEAMQDTDPLMQAFKVKQPPRIVYSLGGDGGVLPSAGFHTPALFSSPSTMSSEPSTAEFLLTPPSLVSVRSGPSAGVGEDGVLLGSRHDGHALFGRVSDVFERAGHKRRLSDEDITAFSPPGLDDIELVSINRVDAKDVCDGPASLSKPATLNSQYVHVTHPIVEERLVDFAEEMQVNIPNSSKEVQLVDLSPDLEGSVARHRADYVVTRSSSYPGSFDSDSMMSSPSLNPWLPDAQIFDSPRPLVTDYDLDNFTLKEVEPDVTLSADPSDSGVSLSVVPPTPLPPTPLEVVESDSDVPSLSLVDVPLADTTVSSSPASPPNSASVTEEWRWEEAWGFASEGDVISDLRGGAPDVDLNNVLDTVTHQKAVEDLIVFGDSRIDMGGDENRKDDERKGKDEEAWLAEEVTVVWDGGDAIELVEVGEGKDVVVSEKRFFEESTTQEGIFPPGLLMQTEAQQHDHDQDDDIHEIYVHDNDNDHDTGSDIKPHRETKEIQQALVETLEALPNSTLSSTPLEEYPDPDLLPLPLPFLLISPSLEDGKVENYNNDKDNKLHVQMPTPPASPPTTFSRSLSPISSSPTPIATPSLSPSLSLTPTSATVSTRPAWSLRASDAPALGLPATPSPDLRNSSKVLAEEQQVKDVRTEVVSPPVSQQAVPITHTEETSEVCSSTSMVPSSVLSFDQVELSTSLPGSFPPAMSGVISVNAGEPTDAGKEVPVPTTPNSVAAKETSTVATTAPTQRRTARSPLDIALAMQLRPGLGLGADPAWMVRFLMSMFGWFAILLSGQAEFAGGYTPSTARYSVAQ